MSYILHLGHQPTDLGYDASAIITTTGAQYFDETLDVNCVQLGRLDPNGLITYPNLPAINWNYPASTSDTTWTGYRLKYASARNVDDNSDYLSFRNDTDGELVKISAGGSYPTATWIITVYGDTTEVIDTGYLASQDFVEWHDFKVTVNANITCEFYIDGSLTGSVTAPNTGGKGKPTSTYLTITDWFPPGVTGTAFAYFAHLAVLDNVPTIGRRFIRQSPTAAGTHTDFAGAVSNLADGSFTTNMSSDTAGQRQSFTLTGPTIPAGGIGSVTITQTSSHIGSGPGKSAGFIKVGGTNYDGTAETVTETPSQIVTTFETNPADSNPWDDTTLPSEYGIVTST